MLPGFIGALGWTGSLWFVGFSSIAPWSIYSLKSALVIFIIAAIHLKLIKQSLIKLKWSIVCIIIGLIVIPLHVGFKQSFDEIAIVDQRQDFTARLNGFSNEVIYYLVHDVTGILFIISALASAYVIFNNRPNSLKKRNIFN